MKSIFLILSFVFMSNAALACQWYGDKRSHKRFGIDIGFIGKLVEKGMDADESGNAPQQWGRFQPVKLIHGKWKLSKKFYFGKKLDYPILILDYLYVIHADKNGEYIVPCFEFAGLESFTSTKDNKYIKFVKYLEEPTPSNYKDYEY